ncbi:unnamed protein product [Citrullus colocynthis]|uniref:AAA+ ATPase domain-containing protein n=1 Tax=Citrullus colocynthis TaxID=252529 RepID=A0ABP0XPG5_9ROSI
MQNPATFDRATWNQCHPISFALLTDPQEGGSVYIRITVLKNFVEDQPLNCNTSMPAWLKWVFWVSPISYGEIGLSVNEFLAPRWKKVQATNTTIGHEVLQSRGLDYHQSIIALPFTPLAVVFQDLRVLCGHSIGALRLGVLTTLIGVSGAGKTTLLNVLAGRITSRYIKREIKIGGFPEQFVNEVLETIELDGIKDMLVGKPSVSGLSTEKRRWLSIAVELVSNPSIIFMDAPTTGLDARAAAIGLDARAAAIVMRVVKNVVDTGRTIVSKPRRLRWLFLLCSFHLSLITTALSSSPPSFNSQSISETNIDFYEHFRSPFRFSGSRRTVNCVRRRWSGKNWLHTASFIHSLKRATRYRHQAAVGFGFLMRQYVEALVFCLKFSLTLEFV